MAGRFDLSANGLAELINDEAAAAGVSPHDWLAEVVATPASGKRAAN